MPLTGALSPWLPTCCFRLWVCGERVSEGMHREIEYAKAAGIEIRYVKEDELNVCSQ